MIKMLLENEKELLFKQPNNYLFNFSAILDFLGGSQLI
jgi:hypothetical protein